MLPVKETFLALAISPEPSVSFVPKIPPAPLTLNVSESLPLTLRAYEAPDPTSI